MLTPCHIEFATIQDVNNHLFPSVKQSMEIHLIHAFLIKKVNKVLSEYLNAV